MSKKFDIITLGLMLFLLIALFFVIFNYFAHPSKLYNSDNDYNLQGSNQNQISPEIIGGSIVNSNVSNTSGEGILSNNTLPESNETNNKSVIDNVYNDVTDKKENSDKIEISNSNQESNVPFIMTSNDNISDREKKEILKELDQTLMDLWDVVDSVQTVDETRLMIEESEVQQ